MFGFYYNDNNNNLKIKIDCLFNENINLNNKIKQLNKTIKKLKYENIINNSELIEAFNYNIDLLKKEINIIKEINTINTLNTIEIKETNEKKLINNDNDINNDDFIQIFNCLQIIFRDLQKKFCLVNCIFVGKCSLNSNLNQIIASSYLQLL